MRNLVGALLCALAALCTAAGVMFHYAQALADTPEPAREIVGPLAEDRSILDMLPDRIIGAALGNDDELLDLIPDFLSESLRNGMDTAISTALQDADLKQAWYESIDLTRTDYVTRLDMVTSGEIAIAPPNFGATDTEGPTMVLQAQPFAALGLQKLDEVLSPVGLQGLLDGLRNGARVEIPLNLPDPTVVSPRTMAQWLAVSRSWLWFFVGAGVLALAGVVVARGRGRAIALLTGAAALMLLSRFVGSVAANARSGGEALGLGGELDPLASLVRDRLLAGLSVHIDQRAEWLWSAGLVTMGVGAVVLVIMILLSRARSQPVDHR